MAFAEKLLLEGETVIVSVRTHVKALFVPFLWGLVTVFVTGFLANWARGTDYAVTAWVVVAIGLVILLVVTVVPFLRWFTWTYTLTDKRLIEQKGILTRSGRIIPLARINDVSFEKGIVDRVLGCGTLVIHDASLQAGLYLHDIPRIEEFHREISALVIRSHEPEMRRDELH